MKSGLSWQLQWMGVVQAKTFSGLVHKGCEGLAQANNTCMHSFTKQYVAQRGAKLSCQPRQLSTQEVSIVIPGRLVVSGRGKARTGIQEHTCQT